MVYVLSFVLGLVGGHLVKKDYEALQAQGITVGTISARGWFWGNFWLLLFFLPAYGYLRHKATSAHRPQKLYGYPQPPPNFQAPAPPAAHVAPPVSAGFCPSCGSALSAQMKFCSACGSRTGTHVSA